VTLDWKDFVAFYELVISCEEVESYAIEHYPGLTYFLDFGIHIKKHGFIPLVGPKQTPPSAWRLGPGGAWLI